MSNSVRRVDPSSGRRSSRLAGGRRKSLMELIPQVIFCPAQCHHVLSVLQSLLNIKADDRNEPNTQALAYLVASNRKVLSDLNSIKASAGLANSQVLANLDHSNRRFGCGKRESAFPFGLFGSSVWTGKFASACVFEPAPLGLHMGHLFHSSPFGDSTHIPSIGRVAQGGYPPRAPTDPDSHL